MLLQGTDKMKQEQSTWFQNFLHAIKKQLIIVTANMLQHTNTDNTVKLILFLGKITIIHQLYGKVIFQSLLFDPSLKFRILLMA